MASFAAWRPLLESESAQQGSVLSGTVGADLAADPYMRLVTELVLPPLRKELTNEWDPRWVNDCEHLELVRVALHTSWCRRPCTV